MKRIPNDLNDDQYRDEYIQNHIKWFLKNHQDSIPEFMDEVKRKYDNRNKLSNLISLFP